jgi:hypothetical protein
MRQITLAKLLGDTIVDHRVSEVFYQSFCFMASAMHVGHPEA